MPQFPPQSHPEMFRSLCPWRCGGQVTPAGHWGHAHECQLWLCSPPGASVSSPGEWDNPAHAEAPREKGENAWSGAGALGMQGSWQGKRWVGSMVGGCLGQRAEDSGEHLTAVDGCSPWEGAPRGPTPTHLPWPAPPGPSPAKYGNRVVYKCHIYVWWSRWARGGWWVPVAHQGTRLWSGSAGEAWEF